MAYTNFNLEKTSGYESGLIAKIASNSLAAGIGTAVKLASGFIDEAGAGDTIEGVSVTTKTFASDNQTVASDVVTYKPVRPDDYYMIPIEGFSIVFAGNFVTSNSITMLVNGVAMTPVVFATDNATTIAAVATQLTTQFASVLGTVTASGANTLLIPTDGRRDTVTITGIAVTLGSSQTTGVVTELISGADVGKFYDITTDQFVNAFTESTTTGQLRLEEFISTSICKFSIANL